MNLKKHALHLAVTAGMVGSMVAVAAPAAHAAAALPDVCAVYLQGTIDPAGGPLPGGIIPLNPPTTSQTYGVAGHVAKGQDKIINDLNNDTAGATRFSAGLTIGGTITGNTTASGPVAPILTAVHGGTPPAGGTTTIKLAWKNDKVVRVSAPQPGTPAVLFPTIQVSETDTAKEKGLAAKGVVNGDVSTDNLGAQVGNVTHGTPLNLTGEVWNLVVPNGATDGTYTLSMGPFPAAFGPPFGGTTITTAPIAFNAGQAAVASALNTAFAAGGGAGTVTGTDFVGGTTNGNYTITFSGPVFQGVAATGHNVPLLTVGTQTLSLATTLLDDGAPYQGTRTGGVDPGISPVSDLGNGIFTSTGVMSSGPVGGVTNPITLKTANTGKSSFFQDTQYTAIVYPSSVVTAVAPNLASSPALPILAAITGLTAGQLGDNCSLGGLLAVFCSADAAVIPATFSGLCGAILI